MVHIFDQQHRQMPLQICQTIVANSIVRLHSLPLFRNPKCIQRETFLKKFSILTIESSRASTLLPWFPDPQYLSHMPVEVRETWVLAILTYRVIGAQTSPTTTSPFYQVSAKKILGKLDSLETHLNPRIAAAGEGLLWSALGVDQSNHWRNY